MVPWEVGTQHAVTCANQRVGRIFVLLARIWLEQGQASLEAYGAGRSPWGSVGWLWNARVRCRWRAKYASGTNPCKHMCLRADRLL